MQNANKTRGVGPLGGSGVVGLWGASSLVARIQSGLVAMGPSDSGTATIVAVDLNNSLLFAAGDYNDYGAELAQRTSVRLTFTNATTITASRHAAAGTAASARFTVVEFLPGILKRVQRGTIVIAGLTSSQTATITAVNTAKMLATLMGTATTSAAADSSIHVALEPTNSTTVTALRNGSGNSATVDYQVAEFF